MKLCCKESAKFVNHIGTHMQSHARAESSKPTRPGGMGGFCMRAASSDPRSRFPVDDTGNVVVVVLVPCGGVRLSLNRFLQVEASNPTYTVCWLSKWMTLGMLPKVVRLSLIRSMTHVAHSWAHCSSSFTGSSSPSSKSSSLSTSSMAVSPCPCG